MFDFLSLSEKKHWWILGACFAVILLIVYGKSLGNGFVILDDSILIFLNPAIQSITPGTLKTIFTTYDPELYIPLTMLSYQFDWLLGGGVANMFHTTSLFIHFLNSLLIVGCVSLLTRKPTVAILTGFLFALHPINTEAISWATGRKDVLATFFLMLSILFYLRYRESGSNKIYWISIVMFLLGILSKVIVITLPAILLLIDYYQNRRISKHIIVDKIPYAVLSVAFLIVASFGKSIVIAETALTTKLLMACKATVFYLQKLILPYPLYVLYPYHEQISISSPDFAVPILILIGIVALLIFTRKRSRLFIFAFGLFLITLAPSLLNFYKLGIFYLASDRYAYIPSIAFLFLIASLIGMLIDRYASARPMIAGILGAAFFVLAMLSFNQSQTWKDTNALFTHVLKHEPRSYMANNNLGHLLIQEGRYSEATEALNRSLEIHKSAEAYFNLGKMKHLSGDINGAFELYKKAIAVNTKHSPSHLNLGAIYANNGQTELAIKEFEEAIKYNPFFTPPRYNLGVMYEKSGNMQKAKKHYQETLQREPGYLDALVSLARVYIEGENNFDKAAPLLKKALSIDPDHFEGKRLVSILVKATQPKL